MQQIRPDNNIAAAQTRARTMWLARATLGETLNFQPWNIVTSAVLTRTAITLTADVAPNASSMSVTALANAVDLGARFWLDDVLWETTAAAAAAAVALSVRRVTEWSPNPAGARTGQTGYVVKLPVNALGFRVYEGEKVKAPNGDLTVIRDAAPGATAIFFRDSGAISVASGATIAHSSVKPAIYTGTPTVPSRSFDTSSTTLSNGTIVAVPNDATTSNVEFQTTSGDTDEAIAITIAADTKDGSNRLMFWYTVGGGGEKKYGFGFLNQIGDTDVNAIEGRTITISPNAAPNRVPSVV